MTKLPIETGNITPSAAVEELRSAMDRVLQAQSMAGIAINQARFDAETQGINHEFLSDVLDILPAQIVPRSGRQPIDFTEVKDPLHLRAATASSVRMAYDQYTSYGKMFFVIGSQVRSTEGNGLTNLLLLRKNADENPEVQKTTLSSNLWNKNRDEAVTSLARSFNQETLTRSFAKNRGAFVIGASGYPIQPTLLAPHSEFVYQPTDKTIARAIKKPYGTGALRAYDTEEIILQGSDIVNYRVIPHLEFLAASFGVGQAFDAVKAKREQAMPQEHPASRILDLPSDYRQAVENDDEFRNLPPALL